MALQDDSGATTAGVARSIVDWFAQLDPLIALTITRGTRILVILVMAWLAFRILKILTARLQRQFEDEDDADERDSAIEQRAKTMVHILNSVGAAAIGIAAGLTIMNLFIPIGPLLAGVGVVGLAISFGAQTLVKDFISGFFILLENQFAVGDIVEVNGKSGVVERVSLRVVSLRDVEGVLHTIPNGAISMVSNKTRTWARAVLDIGVAYKEKVDDVMRVISDVAAQLWEDEDWQQKLVKEPTVWGVQDLGDSSVNVRLVAETKPARQWEVRREMLRRIKTRFDEEGIEIPFPQRTVHLRRGGTDDDRTPS
jgi:small conductance mechanosensitive channel